MFIRARVRILLIGTLFPLVALHAQAIGAQLLGRVLLADSVTRAVGIVVVASDPAGREIARALTDERGGYLLPVPRPARYEIRALRTGFQPTVLPPVALAAGETRAFNIVLRDVAERAPTLAQLPKMKGEGAVLAGRITQAGDSAVLVPGAEVQLLGSGMLHYADNRGQFRLVGVPPGNYELRVRRLGYQLFVEQVKVEDGRFYQHDVELKRLAHALTEVRIEGRTVKVPARYEEAYRHASLGFGAFFTREQIEQRNPWDVQALLQEIPGVHIRSSGGVEFTRCWGGKVQVYIDGVRMTRFTTVEQTLKLVRPTSIQIMEVYQSAAVIPAEFLDDACAVIAIWTKAY